ncbi:hypothetical protein BHM03_00055837 [Ensete ventricosum]|nr:hypothetical protein BHM03_00055837 [Ensete ventricosum]
MEEVSCSSSWTREQEKAFENALATHPEDCSDWWEKIAANVPGKSIEDVKNHYELLLEDINGIESGRVPLPCYPSSSDGDDHANDGSSVAATGTSINQSPQPYGTTVGQPVGGPLIPAVGTPINLLVSGAPHMAYGVRAVVPGAQVNIPPSTYPMPPTSCNR